MDDWQRVDRHLVIPADSGAHAFIKVKSEKSALTIDNPPLSIAIFHLFNCLLLFAFGMYNRITYHV